MPDLASIINDIIVREGDFVDHPLDKGGATRWGITQETLAEWRGKEVDHEDVRLLTQDEARAIYRDRFIIKPRFSELPDPLRALVVDCGVNHGVTRATGWLQSALKVHPDGIVGDQTIAALAVMDAKDIYRKVLGTRVRFYGRLVTDNPKQSVFAAGWANRAASFIESCP